jgi:hypothetical protein
VAILFEEIESVFEYLRFWLVASYLRSSENPTGDPPCTPSFIQLAPYFALSNEIDVA